MNASFLRTLILASALALQPAVAGAVTFIVNVPDQDKPDANLVDGKCSHSPILDPTQFAVCTLRAAIMQGNAIPLNEPVTILVAPGVTYTIEIPGSSEDAAATGDFDLLRPMTIRVPENFNTHAIINANFLDRAFDIREPSTLYGLEVKGGYRNDRDGVAIKSTAPGTLLDRLDIHDNFVDASGQPPCTVEGDFVLSRSHVHRNGTNSAGAHALCGSSSAVTIVMSTIDNNTGNGVLLQSGTFTMQTSTVSGNVGSGVSLINTSGSIRNSTIAHNQNGTQLAYTTTSPGMFNLSVIGSILDGGNNPSKVCNVDNHAFDQGAFTTAWNAYSDLTCFSDTFVDNSLHEADIRLTPLGDFGGPTPTHSLMADSEVIDSAPASVCNNFPVDQRGFTRPISHNGQPMPRCDTGAVELQVGEQQEDVFSDGFE